MRLPIVLLSILSLRAQTPNTDLERSVRSFAIDKATAEDAVRTFGEPVEYLWGDRKFQKDNLPAIYIARFPSGIQAAISSGRVMELRLSVPGLKVLDGVETGATMDAVFQALGRPQAEVEGHCSFAPGVLCKDIGGVKGSAYYASREKRLRLFFMDGKVEQICIARQTEFPESAGAATSANAAVQPFDDVRKLPGAWAKDPSAEDLSEKAAVLPTLTFNTKTAWPGPSRMPASPTPEALLEAGRNPGLGVRKLHARGITGQGVNVAIIDQPLPQGHLEYAGKIAAYHDVGTGQTTSMHGPAVASLLVGETLGTAPGARLYYVAAPSWTGDSAFQAQALRWIAEQNRKLPASRKIRVVSVSAAPSGKSSPFTANLEQWDQAVAEATREGILVLDCTDERGLIYACWFDGNDRETPAQCRSGYPGMESNPFGLHRILAPASPRTTAEAVAPNDFGYQYTGRGGLSWAIPYVAGVLAMGWQVRPEFTPKEMIGLLFQTAWKRGTEALVIDPPAFIQALK